jgi:DNA primase
MPTGVTPPVDLQALKDRHPLAEVVEASGVRLRGRGRVLQSFCPFHREREPSFTVYQDTQRFYCFGCGAKGDVLDFLRLREGLELPEAIRRLDGAFPIAPPPKPRLAKAPGLAHSARDPAVLAAAARFYARALRHSHEAQGYLRGRGIRLETAVRLGLGYAPGEGLRNYLERLGFSEDAVTSSGLFLGEGERFAGRVVVPEVRHGRVTWLVGRSIGREGPRFQALPGEKPVLGLGRLGNPGVVVLTEGLFDWLALAQWGLPACATLGTHGLERVAAALAGCTRVFLAMDTDEAGLQATERLAGLLGARAVPVQLPPGVKDVADLATHPRGRVAFLRLLAHARRLAGGDTMEQATQISLFSLERPAGATSHQEPPARPPGRVVAASEQSPASPGATPATGDWKASLDELGLRPGCAYVYRVNGSLYAWGDFTHCPAEDVAHNIRVLAGQLRRQPSLWGIGKSYQADIYRLDKAGDWDRIQREVRDIYRERLLLVGADGSLTPMDNNENK